MESIKESQVIDEIVWSCIKDSLNPYDHLDFLRHALNRPSQQEKAYEIALANWDNKSTPRLADVAVQKIQTLAESGNRLAMLHLGRWYRLGYFVEINSDTGIAWYQKGADLGCTRCMINIARFKAKQEPEAAKKLYRQAIGLGDLAGHTFLADLDTEQRNYHLEMGATSEDAYARYAWGFHLFKAATNDEERIKAADIIKEAAEQNESMASVFLGIQYRSAKFIPQDEALSMAWLKKAASLGNETACTLIGNKLLGNKKTEQEALIQLRRGAMLDDAYGQFMLGRHLLWQGTTPEQQTEGLAWLRSAAQHGYKPAMSDLADALTQGIGGPINTDEALSWLSQGVAAGQPDCQVTMACHFMTGKLVELDKEKAHNLFNLASMQGSVAGTYFLGCTYEAGDGVEKSIHNAIKCFKDAASQGYAKAQYRLGIAYMFSEGVEEDIPAAAKWLKLAADANLADAQCYLGVMFANGIGVETDSIRAHYWLDMACRQDHQQALRKLGFMLLDGEGLNPTPEKAKRLLAKAAALGDKEAKDWIAKNCPEKPAWLKELGMLGKSPKCDDPQPTDES